MKKFINKMLAVACMIPCAIGLTACGSDGDNQEKLNAEGYTALKSATNTVTEKPVAGTTYEMSSSEKMTSKIVASDILTGVPALANIFNYFDIENSANTQSTFAYALDGTSVMKYKCKQERKVGTSAETDETTENADEEWDEEQQYIVKDGDKYIWFKTFGSGEDQTIDATYVSADHIQYLIENEYMDEYLNAFDTSFVEYINESNTVEEFTLKMKEMIAYLEESGISISADDINATLNTQYDKSTQNYTVNIALSLPNISMDLSKFSDGILKDTTSTGTINMGMDVVFNSERLLSYDMSIKMTSTTTLGFKKFLGKNLPNDSTISSLPEMNISMNMDMEVNSKCEFKEGIDASLIPANLKDQLDETYVIENNPIQLNVFVDNLNGETIAGILDDAHFDATINYETLKESLIAHIKGSYSVDENAFKSIKIYLDKECTIEASIENLTKCPSHDIDLYVKIELNEGYSKVFVNVSTDYGTSKLQLICPVNATITIEDLLNGTNINYVDSIKLDGVSVDLNSANITIGTNGEYTVDIKIDYNKTTSDTTL